jgi:hypothetical protein
MSQYLNRNGNRQSPNLSGCKSLSAGREGVFECLELLYAAAIAATCHTSDKTVMNSHYLSSPMQVKDLTIEEFKLLIQETVAETIQSLIIDPDEGKQIKPEVKQQLLHSLQRTQAGERGIPAEEVAKKLGLPW